LLVSVIAVPVAIIAKDDPIACVFVVGGIICVICMSLVTLIFLPKVRFNREMQKKKLETRLRQNTRTACSSSNDDNDEAARSSAQFEKKVDASGDHTESSRSFQEIGSNAMDQAQEEMKATNDRLRNMKIKVEGSFAELQKRRDAFASNKDSSENDLPRVAAGCKAEPNPYSSVSDDDSDIGLKVIDRRQIREQMKAENESLRQINKKLEERVVVLKSQRHVCAPKVLYKKKERVGVSFESLPETEALVSEADLP
jgi:gas vesicle protein